MDWLVIRMLKEAARAEAVLSDNAVSQPLSDKTTLIVYEPTFELPRDYDPSAGGLGGFSALVSVCIGCSRPRPATSVSGRPA